MNSEPALKENDETIFLGVIAQEEQMLSNTVEDTTIVGKKG